MPERSEIQHLEGHHVSITLLDGSRVEDCKLISAPRHGAQTMWLVTSTGDDLFIPVATVVEIKRVAVIVG